MRKLHYFVLISCFFLSFAVKAQASYASAQTDTQNATAILNIRGCGTANAIPNVSGTMVEFAFSMGFTGNALNPNAINPWTGGIVTGFTVTIGGESVPIPDPAADARLAEHSIRFASTHFPDATTLAIVVTAKFQWTRPDPENPGTYIKSAEEILTANANLRTWNRSAILATQEIYDATSQSFLKPGDSGYPSPVGANDPPEVARRIGVLSVSFLSTVNHTNLDPVPPEQMTKDLLAPFWNRATLFIACTHGSPTSIRACFTDELTNEYIGGLTYAGDRSHNTTGRSADPATAPPYNLAILYCCETLNGNLKHKFDVSGQNTFWYDRAYLGFSRSVFAFAYGQGNQVKSLDAHAEVLLKNLADGATIRIAKERADRDVMPSGPGGERTPIQILGDTFLKIQNVYMSESEIASNGGNNMDSWYWVRA